MPRGNKDNLVPNEARSPEERRKNAQIAGKASGRARKKKAALRAMLQDGMQCAAPASTKKIMRAMQISDPDDATVAVAIAAQLLRQAVLGDMQAIQLLTKIIGDTAYDERQDKKLRLMEKEINAKIEMLRIQQAQLQPESEEKQDDGFLSALSASASSDWEGDEQERPAAAEEDQEGGDG